METAQLITLSLIQGITEFLPISSSGHLVILPQLFDWPDQGLVFDIAVHLGTLMAVLWYFRVEVITLFCGGLDVLRRRDSAARRLFYALALSTVPLVMVAPFVGELIELYLRHMVVVGVASIGFGLLLWRADQRPQQTTELTSKNALIYGLFQVLALIPGTSRSGICMTAGRLMGFSRRAASRYAMLMSIPVLIIASGYSLLRGGDAQAITWQTEPLVLLSALILAGVSAFAAIHLLMTWVTRLGFLPFVVYRVGLGAILIALGLR